MRAVVIEDGRIEVGERPDPAPGPDDVLVRVRAAGLNGADLLQRDGRYPPPPGTPADLPGLEHAGEVVEVGRRVDRFAVGDRVMGLVTGAGQAELVVSHQRLLMPVPEGLDWPEAGGLPEVFVTAHDALFTQAHVVPGDRVLVNGAAGGVGVAAVQLAAAIGAHVVASIRTPGLRDHLRRLGAAEIVAPDEVGALDPVDVVIEMVGAPTFDASLDRLAVEGRMVVVGVGGGDEVRLRLGELMWRRARIHGTTLRPRPLEEKAIAIRRVEHEVLPLLATGRLVVPVEATFALPDAAQAYERFARGRKLGKVVLTFG